jgi:uncharacterized protein YidB (DUF937 family)
MEKGLATLLQHIRSAGHGTILEGWRWIMRKRRRIGHEVLVNLL